MPIRAVIFDVDGVLVDSEASWFQAAVEFIRKLGQTWTEHDHHLCMGFAPVEWARYMRERFRLSLSPQVIQAAVIDLMRKQYEKNVPVLPGALEAVHAAAGAYEVAVASGSPLELINHLARLTGLETVFKAIVSGSDVGRGKPAPDIYLEAARRLDVAPRECVGIEDSANGILSVKAAGMFSIAVPAPAYPLPEEVLRKADRVLPSLEDFSVGLVQSLCPERTA